jgi:predicted nucleotidyltransferase
MRRDDAVRILKEHAADLRQAGVAHVSLFGSVAHGTAQPSSDVDLIVETTADHPITLFTIGPLHDLFSRLLGVPVDVIDKAGFDRAERLQRRAGQLFHVF